MREGYVESVDAERARTFLAADAVAGQPVLVVQDAEDFLEAESVTVDGAIYDLVSVDLGDPEDEAATSTLTLATNLGADVEAGEPVDVSPEKLTLWATVSIPGEVDSLTIRVPQTPGITLPLGIRTPEAREVVTYDEGSDGMEITSINGQALIQADLLDPNSTIPDGALDDTQMRADLDAAEAAIVVAEGNAQSALDAAAQAVLDAAAASTDAGLALTAANGKNQIVFDTGPATGTSSGGVAFVDGDVWFQKTSGLIVGQWEFVSGAWASRTIDNAVIANVNAGKITAGILDAGAVTIRTAASGAMLVLAASGLIGYAPDGVTPKTVIDSATGVITAVDGNFTGTVNATSGNFTGIIDLSGSGVLRTAASGQRVQVGTSGVAAYGLPNLQVDAFSIIGRPLGLAVDSSGNTYVADYDNSLLRKYNSSGVQTLQIATPGYPQGVAVDASGNIYITDGDNFLVRKYNSSGTAGINFSTTGYPQDIALDSSGNMYVADYTNARIRKYNSSGTAGINFTTTGNPAGVAVDSSGNIYVTDFAANLVRKYNSSGTQTLTFTTPGFPQGIDVDSAGNVYVADQDGAAIRKYNSAGTLQATFQAPQGAPNGVAVSSSNYVYASDYYGQMVRKYTQGNDLSVLIDSSTGLLSATQMTVTGGLDADLIMAQTIIARGNLNIRGPGSWPDVVPTSYTSATRTVAGASATCAVRYMRVGKNVKVEGVVTFTGAATGTVLVPPPTTAASGQSPVIGTCQFFDSSVGVSSRLPGIVTLSGTLQLAFQAINGSPNAYASASTPWSWASGDTISFTVEYREA